DGEGYAVHRDLVAETLAEAAEFDCVRRFHEVSSGNRPTVGHYTDRWSVGKPETATGRRSSPRPVPVIASGEAPYAACREASGRAEKRTTRLRPGAVLRARLRPNDRQ